MNFEEVKRAYDRDGFALIPDYLSAAELTELRDRAVRLSDELFTKKESKGILKGLEKYDSWFENQLLRGKHVELLKVLLEDDLQPASAAFFDRPSGSTTGIEPPPGRDRQSSRAEGRLYYLAGSGRGRSRKRLSLLRTRISPDAPTSQVPDLRFRHGFRGCGCGHGPAR